ncbi:MAG TPA: hypothetical protein VID26_10910 [Candidatus Limnocylindrales bacterium]
MTHGGSGDPVPVRARLEQPVVPLGGGSSRRPVGLAVVVGLLLATLVWQPWSGGLRPAASPGPQSSAAVANRPAASAAAGPAATPRPGAESGTPDTADYLSLIDNEWTVVALLSPTLAGPAEEPALPHPTALPGSGAPLLVLQQGVNFSTKPIERPGHPNLPCTAKAVPRLRLAVPLPSDRVLYLGVTYPGMDPAAAVTVADLDGPNVQLSRVRSLIVSLSGQPIDASYRLPNAGPGAVAMFALPRGTALPKAAYRFEIDAPGVGRRYLYACVS